MITLRTFVFAHLAPGPVPAGLLTLVDEPRDAYATFSDGRHYLQRPDRIPVDPITLPLPMPGLSTPSAPRRTLRFSTACATPCRTAGVSP